MNPQIRQKLAKVYALVERGIAGEKDAAKEALDRLIKKYNLDAAALDDLTKNEYRFKYSTDLELQLFCQLVEYFLDSSKHQNAYRDLRGVREIVVKLEYLDFVLLSSAYEYFRRHMKKEYNRLVMPQLKKCRYTRTKTQRRKQLSPIFFSNYVIASKLYKEDQVRKLDVSEMTEKEKKDRARLDNVKGGQYNTQVTTGLYLEQ